MINAILINADLSPGQCPPCAMFDPHEKRPAVRRARMRVNAFEKRAPASTGRLTLKPGAQGAMMCFIED